MKIRDERILVLGAGMVAPPLVHYLLDNGFPVTVASRTLEKAEKLVRNWSHGAAEHLNAKNTDEMEKLISNFDLVISLLPPSFHVTPAKMCVDAGIPMVTTSYVSDEMEALDKKAKQSGVLLLNEIGLDPGIDHMSAVETIDKVHDEGGEIKSFRSYCGALPAPEENFNPLGYKFSWHPKGVLHASKNSAKFLEDGEVVEIEGKDLFAHYTFKDVQGLGCFEQYANRNSVPYIDKYGIPETDNIYRGTFRNVGWCEALKKMVNLGLLGQEELDFSGMSYGDLANKLAGGPSTGKDSYEAVADYLGLDNYSRVMKILDWLGLFEPQQISLDRGTPLDVLASLMEERLAQGEGERDMIILQHEFEAKFDDRTEEITSTFIDYGDPEGYTSIAKTVGVPAAIGAKFVLEGKFDLTGVHIPVLPQIYDPVLRELENQDIEFEESKRVK